METTTEVKEPIYGKFKTKEKFIEFVGGKGNVNFISDEAIIEGVSLSGLGMDGIQFKLTIRDGGTVDFDEIDTNKTTEEQRGRLLEVISDKTITPFRSSMVISELQFLSTKSINGKTIPLYLSVEWEKPIDKLKDLLSEDLAISEEQSSKLDQLMSFFDDEEPKIAQTLFTSETDEELARELEGESDTEDIDSESPFVKVVQDSFTKMKEDKITELKSRLQNKENELIKFRRDVSMSQKKVEDTESEISLLQSRLDDIQPTLLGNGFIFNVSEIKNEKVILDEKMVEIMRSKFSKIKSLNVDALMSLFEEGEYQVKLATKEESGFIEVTDILSLPQSIQDLITEIGFSVDENAIFYRGQMTWGDIVNKLLKYGFTQDSQFDQLCGSNSYNQK